MTTPKNFSVTQFQHPKLSVPPPLMMSQPGTFAHYTLTQRWPAIAQRIIQENNFPTPIVNNLRDLIQELPNGKVRSLQDQSAPDTSAWQEYLAPVLGLSWLEIPWYFAESYFYRRILEATQYFIPSPWQGFDPFSQQKQAGLAKAINTFERLESQQIEPLLSRSLWGNQADLSLKPEQENEQTEINLEHILVDDSPLALEYLNNHAIGRIDLIADNAGSELLCDLLLVDFLLTTQRAKTVHLHLKGYPTFVSDATVEDFNHAIAALKTDTNLELRTLASRLENYLASEQIKLRSNLFWTAPLVFWEMPDTLQADLAQASLVLMKGDANYRRLLGDCQWSFTTRFADIVCYFPTPVLALRTLKSEIVAGLQPQQVEEVSRQDPQWLVNGQWGLIQFAPGNR